MQPSFKLKALLYVSLGVSSLCLSACSTTQEAPIGIGSGTDDLKQNPCCVGEKEPFYINGRWIN